MFLFGLSQPGVLGRAGLGADYASTISAVFNPALTTLSDVYGNVAEAISVAGRTVVDYAGTVTTVPITTHSLNRGRLSGGVWYDDDGAGNPLHPTAKLGGAPINRSVQKYTTATTVSAGAEMYDAGKYYFTALGGTTNGATLLTDTGVTDWVEQGLYQPDYGVLLEGSGTNNLTHSTFRKSTAFTNYTGGAGTSTNVGIGVDGVANSATTLTDNDGAAYVGFWTIGLAAGSGVNNNHISVRLGKNSAYICAVQVVLNGSTVNTIKTAYIDTTSGLLSTDTSTGFDISEFNSDYWSLNLNIAHSLNEAFTVQFKILPCMRATLNGAANTALVGSLVIDWPQIEMSVATPSSLIDPNTPRADSMGAIKWSTIAPAFGGNGFPHANGNMFLTIVPQYASGDLAASSGTFIVDIGSTIPTSDTILNLWKFGIHVVNSTDGVNILVANLLSYLRNDAIQLNLRWGLGADPTQPSAVRMQLSYRMASVGGAWVHVASVPYDGAFNDTGFLQLLKALGLNNTIFQQLPVIHDTPMTNAALDAIV